MKILIGTPIKQSAAILRFYLESLESLEKEDWQVHYCFVDDNDEEASHDLLTEFANKHQVTILSSEFEDEYVKTDNTHHWNDNLIWKVANFKNEIIQKAVKEEYDYLFFVDSDLALHPNTLQQLVIANKEVISEIFWTKWTKDATVALPQVWVSDQYTLYEKKKNESLTQEEANKRTWAFIEKLKKPGVYEVGGLGALTLIHKDALLKGVHFGEIKNLSFTGEDRHFCVRAGALGIDLYVDTHYPAYHIYRPEDLEKLKRIRNK